MLSRRPRPRAPGDRACGAAGPTCSAPRARRPPPAAAPSSDGLDREEERDAGPAAGRGVDLDPAPVGGDDALGDREAEPAAVRLAGVERLEHPAQLGAGDAGPGVA